MNDHRRGRALRYAALIATLALTAAACGSDDDDGSSDTTAGTEAPAASEAPAATDAPADTEAAAATDAPAETDAPDTTDGATGTDAAEPAGEPEKADVKLGIIPIADVAPVFIGIEQGFFEEEGLTVSTEFAQGGAASIPSVVSGDIDFAFGAYPSFFSAVQEGLPLLISTEANRAAPLFGGLYALPDSGIATPADLEGKTIAVNTLNNLVQLAVEAQLVDAGLTLDDVTLVEIPFPDMVAALERGDVDVIAVVEPFGTIAKNSLDAVLVTDMFAGRIEGFPVAGFYVTESFAADNPNTVAAFNRAWAKSVDYANNTEDAVPLILPTYIETTTVEAARLLNYPLFVSGIDTDVIQIVPDFMVEAGLLDAPIDVTEHVVE